MELTGNTILITGGGSGLGRGLAEAFHALGNTVVIAGRSRKKLDETTAANPGMTALTVDMTDAGSIREFAAQAAARHPDLDVLINMAGVMVPEDLAHPQEPPADAEAMVVTNLLGPIRLSAALLPHLLARPRATLMNVSSGLAFLPMAMTPTYCATKAAVHSYTESLRYQLRETGVEVLELIPPYVQTELMGPDMARDPNAMPLPDFIAEVMGLLGAEPTPAEICVRRVVPLRDAPAQGRSGYAAQFQQFNDAMTAAAHGSH